MAFSFLQDVVIVAKLYGTEHKKSQTDREMLYILNGF